MIHPTTYCFDTSTQKVLYTFDNPGRKAVCNKGLTSSKRPISNSTKHDNNMNEAREKEGRVFESFCLGAIFESIFVLDAFHGRLFWRARLVVCEGPDFHPAQYYYGKLLEKGGHHPHHKSIVVPPGDQTSGKIFAASLFQLRFSKNPPASIPSTPASHPEKWRTPLSKKLPLVSARGVL